MNFGEYQKLAHVTANKDLDTRGALTNGALGLAGEAGETADYLKKHLFHGHELDRDKLRSELGDVLWYVANLCSAADLSMDEVASFNIDKLRARYPEGFDKERSRNRSA